VAGNLLDHVIGGAGLQGLVQLLHDWLNLGAGRLDPCVRSALSGAMHADQRLEEIHIGRSLASGPLVRTARALLNAAWISSSLSLATHFRTGVTSPLSKAACASLMTGPSIVSQCAQARLRTSSPTPITAPATTSGLHCRCSHACLLVATALTAADRSYPPIIARSAEGSTFGSMQSCRDAAACRFARPGLPRDRREGRAGRLRSRASFTPEGGLSVPGALANYRWLLEIEALSARLDLWHGGARLCALADA